MASFLQRDLAATRDAARASTCNCLFLFLDDEQELLALGVLDRGRAGWAELIIPLPSPRHIAAQQSMARCLQEHGSAPRRGGRERHRKADAGGRGDCGIRAGSPAALPPGLACCTLAERSRDEAGFTGREGRCSNESSCDDQHFELYTPMGIMRSLISNPAFRQRQYQPATSQESLKATNSGTTPPGAGKYAELYRRYVASLVMCSGSTSGKRSPFSSRNDTVVYAFMAGTFSSSS